MELQCTAVQYRTVLGLSFHPLLMLRPDARQQIPPQATTSTAVYNLYCSLHLQSTPAVYNLYCSLHLQSSLYCSLHHCTRLHFTALHYTAIVCCQPQCIVVNCWALQFTALKSSKLLLYNAVIYWTPKSESNEPGIFFLAQARAQLKTWVISEPELSLAWKSPFLPSPSKAQLGYQLAFKPKRSLARIFNLSPRQASLDFLVWVGLSFSNLPTLCHK